MEWIPSGLLDGVGTVSVVVLVGWLVMTGRLVPRRTYQDKVDECDRLHKQIDVKDEQNAFLREQNRLAYDVGHTMNAIMRAVQQGPPSGGR